MVKRTIFGRFFVLSVGILALSMIGNLIDEPTTVVAQSQTAVPDYNSEIRPISRGLVLVVMALTNGPVRPTCALILTRFTKRT